MRGAWVRRARHWIANRGWRGFAAEVWRRLVIVLRRRRLPGLPQPAARAVHPFDERYGAETGGLIFGEELRTERGEELLPERGEELRTERGEELLSERGEELLSERGELRTGRDGRRRAGRLAGERGRAGGGGVAYWATAYYGISPSVFWAALERLGLEWERYTFMDVGCGKGRALMLATRFPFREIAGVELAPELAETARGNLGRFRAEWRLPVPVQVVCGDATRVALPSGPLVLSLYHPFAAPVMERFLASVEGSLGREPREIWLLYANPELDPMLRARPWLRVMWDECLPMSEEDRAADRFGSEWERIVAYRTTADAES